MNSSLSRTLYIRMWFYWWRRYFSLNWLKKKAKKRCKKKQTKPPKFNHRRILLLISKKTKTTARRDVMWLFLSQGTIWTSSWCDTSADGRDRSSSPFKAMSQTTSTLRRLPACHRPQTEVRLLSDVLTVYAAGPTSQGQRKTSLYILLLIVYIVSLLSPLWLICTPLFTAIPARP